MRRNSGSCPRSTKPSARHGAKLKLDLLDNPAFPVRGKLILVTATTPTTSGEGKTVVSIGLAQGLEHIGRKAIVTSREPSLGPVFGLKGGAAGGGLSQVEPSQQINLHFHGDFHAITAAHNLLAAMIDSHLFFGNALDLDPAQITWPRAEDMNDRALRRVIVSAGQQDKPGREGGNRETSFVITAASEIMAILGLASSRADLRRRLDSIVVGVSRCGPPGDRGRSARNRSHDGPAERCDPAEPGADHRRHARAGAYRAVRATSRTERAACCRSRWGCASPITL